MKSYHASRITHHISRFTSRILRFVFCALALLLLLLSSAHAQRPVFTETFDDPALPGWEHSPGAAVVDGVLRLEPGNFAFHSGEGGDMILTVRVRFSGQGAAVISYRAGDQGAYHVLVGSNVLALQREAEGKVDVLQVAPYPISPDEWLQVGVAVTGGEHTITINDEMALVTTDPDPLPPGGVGFEAMDEATAEFDDLTLSSTSEAPIESALLPDVADVTYATVDGEALTLDIYRPEGDGPWPVVIYIHGGGFIGGDKSEAQGHAAGMRAHGYATVSINYRLAPQHPFPAAVADVQCALLWVRQHAAEYNLDPTRVALMGSSAGGHLAALAGLSAAPSSPAPTWQPSCGDPNADLQVQAVVSFSGPMDLAQVAATEVGREAMIAFLGSACEEPQVCAAASPVTYAAADAPPTLLVHGTADEMVLPVNAERMYQALQAAGAEVVYIPVQGAGHTVVLPEKDEEKLWDFLARHLAEGKAAPGATPPPVTATPTPAPQTSGAPAYQTLSWVRTGGPPGGLGYDIRYNFADPNIWYVTDNFAGVHISTDNGLTWQPSNAGIPPQLGPTVDWIPIFCLTVDPHDPQIVWAGTDKTGHIYKSTDGGRTWTEMDNGVDDYAEGVTFRGFTVDPRSSDIVYAAGELASFAWNNGVVRWGHSFDLTKGFVYKTTDGGQNWELIWTGDNLARYVWIDPRDPDVIYVSTGIFDREAANSDPDSLIPGGVGVIKSTDGGQTWQEVNNGLDNLYVGSLFMHPENPDILLAGTGNNLYPQNAGVYRTTDGGQSWTHVLPMGEKAHITSVELCPSNPNIGYAGGAEAVFRTEDAGQTWEMVSGGAKGWGPPGVMAGWPIDMQCDPRDPNRIFANNYNGGNFLSEDGGRTWRNASDGYTGAQTRSVAVDPTNPGRVYAAGRSGLWRTDNGGTVWYGLYYPPPGGSVFGLEWQVVATDPGQPAHVLAGNMAGGTIVESQDGGASWQVRMSLEPIKNELQMDDLEGQATGVIVFAPSDPSVVYAGFCYDGCSMMHDPLCNWPSAGVFVSHDGGTTWQRTEDERIRDVGVLDLAVDPTDAPVVYAAAATGLFKTTDGGETWTPLTGLPEGLPFRAVAVNPDDPQHVLAGIEGVGVYVSADGGTTWQEGVAGLESNSSLHDIVFDPTDPRIVYLSDYLSGVYRSTDGGLTWVKLNSGLRNRAAMGLAISADGRHLYLATDGEGVYRLDLKGRPPQSAPGVTPAIPPTPTSVAAAPTATPAPEPEPPAGRGICGGVAALPLALAGLVWGRRRR